MTSETGNAKGRKEQFGSSGDNPARQQQQSQAPDHSNGRDREGRKGGSNEKNI